MNPHQELQEQPIGKLLWKFSLPAVIGMTVNSLYNIVDRIFVGQGVGSIGIATTTVAFPIMIIFFAVSVLIGIGSTALISIRMGQGKYEEAEKIMGNGTIMLVILPLLLSVIYYLFNERILIFFGSSPDVLPYARDYTDIVILGSVFGSISVGMTNYIRADGRPKTAMLSQILGGVTNVVLNYLFTFKMGMGIKGLAWATIIGQFASSLWVLSYFLRDKSAIKLRFKNFRPQLTIIFKIISIGFAPFGLQMANSVQQTILNKTLQEHGGDMALSAVGIILSVATILFMPVVGVSQGAQPIIGYNYGAEEYGRVKETLKKAVIVATCMVLVNYIIIHIWPAQIIGLFNKDPDLIALTKPAMLVYFTMMPIIGFQIICSNYFQAVGKPVQSAILSLSRQILFFIPLLLILPNYWGIEGVWRTPPIADSSAVILTACLIIREMKNLPKTVSSEESN
ncbi:MAG: MATE family efflux transporter [Peptococcia bacterium]